MSFECLQVPHGAEDDPAALANLQQAVRHSIELSEHAEGSGSFPLDRQISQRFPTVLTPSEQACIGPHFGLLHITHQHDPLALTL